MLLYSLFLCLGLICLSISLLNEWSWVMDFYIMNLGSLTVSFSFLIEKYNSTFIVSVLVIFMMVFVYSFSYLSQEVYLKRFLLILTLFATSMCILIIGGNLFSSLIGWDGLGVTSLFLILFYYSKSALKASTLTFLMNRVGDCFFIMALTQTLLMSESLVGYSCSSFTDSLAMLLILTSITKSAQIPFSTWLPAAMEAPTPVSALVHSSTLVTAGIYLLFRYQVLWVDSPLKDFLMVLSVGTCFMAALSALVESDLKKLIALSTLSQLGFIMFSFSLNMPVQGFIHMLMHAYFKALLFMCAGLVIHSFKGSQSISDMSLSGKQNPLLMCIMSCSLLSMMGLPFLSGFYSKDLILDSLKFNEWSTALFLILLASFVLTLMYSVRVMWYLMNSSSNWHSMSDSHMDMVKPMLPLATLASLAGSMITWLLVEVEFYIETSKVVTLTVLGMALAAFWWQKDVKTSIFFLESKWNLSTFNPVFSNEFFYKLKNYNYSSELQGIPEVFNSAIKISLSVGANRLAKTMVVYSGSLEFLVFLAVIMLWPW